MLPAIGFGKGLLEAAHLVAHGDMSGQKAFERGVDLLGAESRLVQAHDGVLRIEGVILGRRAIGRPAGATGREQGFVCLMRGPLGAPFDPVFALLCC